MNISLITCYTCNYVIGANNRLPWHLPADLARFKQLTTGHILVMGRKTYDSIGHPLVNRTNVVLSRNRLVAPGCCVISSLAELHTLAGDKACFVIGGAQIYRLFIPLAHRIYHTLVKTESVRGDTYFPIASLKESDWRIAESYERPADAQNKYDLCFRRLERKTRVCYNGLP